jgi:hypothetical protein
MALVEKAVDLLTRFGKPLRFGAKMLLGSLLPGSSSVVELVDQVLEDAEEVAEGRRSQVAAPPATAEDLRRVEHLLDLGKQPQYTNPKNDESQGVEAIR